jgi:hypothetical protein
VKKFLCEAIVKLGFKVPAEFVCDFSSANASDLVSEVFEYLTWLYREDPIGFNWTISSNSNRKGILERFFGTFCSVYLSPHLGYLGEGLLATRDSSHPAKVVEIFLNDPSNLDDIEVLKSICRNFLEQFNKNGIDKYVPSPNRRFAEMVKGKFFNVEEHHVAAIFFPKEVRTLSRSQVVIDNEFYQANCDEEEFVKQTDKEVDCYVDKQNSKVFLFRQNTRHFLATASRPAKPSSARANQTQDDRKILNEQYKAVSDTVAKIMARPGKRRDRLIEKMGGQDPTEFIQALVNSLLPEKLDLSVVTGVRNAPDTKKVNPHDIPLKAMEKVHKKKAGVIASSPTDTMRSKLQ